MQMVWIDVFASYEMKEAINMDGEEAFFKYMFRKYRKSIFTFTHITEKSKFHSQNPP